MLKRKEAWKMSNKGHLVYMFGYNGATFTIYSVMEHFEAYCLNKFYGSFDTVKEAVTDIKSEFKG